MGSVYFTGILASKQIIANSACLCIVYGPFISCSSKSQLRTRHVFVLLYGSSRTLIFADLFHLRLKPTSRYSFNWNTDSNLLYGFDHNTVLFADSGGTSASDAQASDRLVASRADHCEIELVSQNVGQRLCFAIIDAEGSTYDRHNEPCSAHSRPEGFPVDVSRCCVSLAAVCCL